MRLCCCVRIAADGLFSSRPCKKLHAIKSGPKTQGGARPTLSTTAGDDVAEKMDRGKSDEQLEIEAMKMADQEKRFAMYVDAWEGTWGYGFGRFQDKNE